MFWASEEGIFGSVNVIDWKELLLKRIVGCALMLQCAGTAVTFGCSMALSMRSIVRSTLPQVLWMRTCCEVGRKRARSVLEDRRPGSLMIGRRVSAVARSKHLDRVRKVRLR